MGEFIIKLLAQVFESVASSLWLPGTPEAGKQNLTVIGGAILLIFGLLVAIYIAS